MLKPGMFISDRYEIIDKVGSGGMADVYKAKDQRLNRFIAIKVLKPEYSSDKSFVNKFRGEAQSAAGLSHPNIVNVYDVGDDSGLHYIVMELVEGITLKRFIERKGKLEVKEAVGIAIQIAQGMEAAHGNHIIHRDIKPQNIIISRDGKVKVTDFGIAKATNSNTLTSNTMGSVHYLSPEQARGGYSDEKSDIYSLGVTLYEMLSGKVPFAGDNTVSVALLHIQGEAMPLRDLDSAIPISVDKIVQKCMQKRPERRYHSVSDFISDLKRAIANPDGDFVQIPAFVANDSPTINIADDLGKIKNGAYLEDDLHNLQTSKLIEEEEEELDTVNSKMDKVFAIGSIVTAVILLIAIILIVVLVVLPNIKSGKREPENPDVVTVAPTDIPTPTETIEAMYKVPAVLGLTETDARASITAKAPDANIMVTEDYSDTFEKGLVMKQYPEANSEVGETSTVLLTISTGPLAFELPSVYGLTELQADKKLRDDYGLMLKHEYIPSDLIENGRVISTIPEHDTKVVKGDTVTIIVSTGRENEQITVPDLINSTEANASRMLTNLGLVLGNVSYDFSDTYLLGRVTYQSNTAGQKVDAGTIVDIIISKGPEETPPGGGNVEYIGRLTINDINPFDYISEAEAEITLEMEQNGWKSTIKEPTMYTALDFPLSIEGIEGDGNTRGIVRMFVDDVLFKLPGETEEYTWIVEFETVEE